MGFMYLPSPIIPPPPSPQFPTLAMKEIPPHELFRHFKSN